MSSMIDSRVVEMKFDNKNFESNVKTSMNTLDKLKQGLNFSGVADSFDEISSSAKKVDFSTLSGAVETVHQKFSAMEVVAIIALVNITNQAINTGEQLIKSLSVDNIAAGWEKFTDKTQSVATLISQGYDLETVNDQLERLNWYTDETSYNFTDMVANIAKFTASGQDLETSVTAMEGIANWAALSGQNATTASNAMYQLAQAMSAGYMRLEDYKSVQNASMDTEEFRQKCIDAGVALGTLQKNSDGTYTSIVDGATESTFSLSSFTTSLTEGAWLTSDVMMEVFNNYSNAVDQIYEYSEEKGITASEAIEELGDEVDEFGLKAFKAAQEARSWADVIDSVKDAVSTGWMNTFEIIFGDYEEATELWTDLANELYDVFAEGGNSRNELLTAWKGLGGRDDLVEAFWNVFYAITDIINTVKDAWHDIFPATTAKQLYSFTAKLKELTEKFKMSDETAEKLKDTFKGLFSILKIGKTLLSAVYQILSPLWTTLNDGTNGVLNLASSLGKMVTRFSDALESSKKFAEIVERLQSVVKVLADYISNFFDHALYYYYSGGSGLSGVLNVLCGSFRDLAEMVLDAIEALTGFDLSGVKDSVSDTVGILQEKAIPIFQTVCDTISDFIRRFTGGIDASPWMLVKKAVQKVVQILKKLWTIMGKVLSIAGSMASAVISAFTGMGEALEECNILQILGKIWDALCVVGKAVVTVIDGLLDGIFSKLGNGEFVDLIDLLNSLLTGGLIVSLIKFIRNLKSTASGLVDSILGVLDSLSCALDTWKNGKNAQTLLTIASSVMIMVVALKILEGIDSTSLLYGLAALMAVIKELSAATNFIDKMNVRTGAALVELAIAIAIIASALKSLAELSWSGIAKAVVSLTAIMYEIVAAVKILQISDKSLKNKVGITTGTMLIEFATAIRILASAFKSLGELSWSEIEKAVVSFTVIMTEIVGAVTILRISDESLGSKVGITTGTMLIEFAMAIQILASAFRSLLSLNWEEISKSVVSLTIILGEITAAVKILQYTGKTDKPEFLNETGVSVGLMLIEFAAAIQIMSSAFRSFSSMNWEDIGKAALAFTVVLGEITAAVKILQYSGKSFGNDVGVSTGLMLIELAASLEIIVDVVKKLADIDANGISKSLVVLGVILAELAAFTVIVSGSKNMMLIATSMVIMGVALEVIADVIEKLAAIKQKSLAQSLVVLAGTFVVLAVAANLLSGSVGIILALSAALVLLGAGLTLIGVGVTAISVGISSLGASLTVAVTGIVASILILVEGLASLIPIGLRITKEWITGICEVIVESVPAIGEAIKAIVLTVCDVVDECAPQLISTILTLLLTLFDALAEYAPQIVDKLVTFLIGVIDTLTAKVPELIDSIANLINAFVHAIMEQLEKIDTSTLIQSIAVVGMVAALMYALSGLGSLLGPAMVGVLAAGVIIAEIALVLAAIGGLNQISGLQWLISEGGDLLEAIGVAIGQFIGGIADGIMTGITEQFGEIGTDLSEFMENAQPFIDGASSINASMLDGITALMKAILLLTVADILSGIASWITGDSSIGEFAEELVPFGEAMVKFADTVDGLDANVIENAATAGKALTELANTVPNTGGVVGWFVGENDLDDFGEKLVAFGEGMKSFADSVKDLDTETVVNAATVGEALTALADTVPNTGGVVGWFVGENDLDIFGDQLVTFGEGMKSFSESVKGIDTNAVVNAATVGESLTALADTVPNTGGVVEFFTGNNDLDTFGDQLSDFRKGMKSFASSIKGIDTKAVSNAATAGKALATLANSLPTTGGVVGWLMGEQDMGTFGEQFVPFGKAMKGFSDTVTGMDAEAVTASATAGQALAELAASLPTEGGVFSWFTGETMDMSTFGTQLVGFGEGLKAYSDAITADDGLDANAIESSATAAAALSELASGLPTEGGVFSWFTGDTINMDEFGEKLPAFGEGLKAYNDIITADDGLDENAIESSATAAGALSELASGLPTEGGVFSWFTGDTLDMDEFGEKLPAFGKGLKMYNDIITAGNGIDDAAIDDSANAASSLAKLLNTLPEEDGVFSWFTGNKINISQFGKKLPAFGEGLKAYNDAITADGGIDSTAVSSTTEAAKVLVELSNALEGTEGGFFSLFTGDEIDLSDFGDTLGDFGAGLKKYYDAIAADGGIKTDVMTATTNAASKLVEMANSVSDSYE